MSSCEEYRKRRMNFFLPCGWCKLHRMSITLNELKSKKCLAKGCWHLKKYAGHPYWDERDQIKALKKQKKGGRENEKNRSDSEKENSRAKGEDC